MLDRFIPENYKPFYNNHIKDKNVLDLRGYVGIALLGRTSTWTRAK